MRPRECPSTIPGNGAQFVGDDTGDIILLRRVFGQSVNGLLHFGFKRAEDPVPDDEYSAVVLIQVIAVLRMVYPVMGWSIEKIFKPAG